jgi:hypothetical protein
MPPVTSVSAQVSDAPGKVLWKQIQPVDPGDIMRRQEGLAVDVNAAGDSDPANAQPTDGQQRSSTSDADLWRAFALTEAGHYDTGPRSGRDHTDPGWGYVVAEIRAGPLCCKSVFICWVELCWLSRCSI